MNNYSSNSEILRLFFDFRFVLVRRIWSWPLTLPLYSSYLKKCLALLKTQSRTNNHFVDTAPAFLLALLWPPECRVAWRLPSRPADLPAPGKANIYPDAKGLSVGNDLAADIGIEQRALRPTSPDNLAGGCSSWQISSPKRAK